MALFAGLGRRLYEMCDADGREVDSVPGVKADTHPDYPVVTISCACGSSFESRSTKGDYSVEVCSECHPFYTGTQKLIDVGGRVERFNKRRAKQASS